MHLKAPPAQASIQKADLRLGPLSHFKLSTKSGKFPQMTAAACRRKSGPFEESLIGVVKTPACISTSAVHVHFSNHSLLVSGGQQCLLVDDNYGHQNSMLINLNQLEIWSNTFLSKNPHLVLCKISANIGKIYSMYQIKIV